MHKPRRRLWSDLAVIAGAIIGGLVIGMAAANVWPILLFKLAVPVAAAAEIAFLALYVWWVAGGGPPARLRAIRAECFRRGPISPAQWLWGIGAALGFAATVHAAIVLLFRFEPFPAAAFHRGYDFSFISSRSLQWLACIVSALSAGVCEETGFRGYMQRPIENRYGPVVAILISSLLFTLIHLNKGWALIGMVPIVFAAGLLLGTLTRASGTLVFGMLGHWIMDIGLFAYWWTQIAGSFTQRTIFETGADASFRIECTALAVLLSFTVYAIRQLARIRRTRADVSLLAQPEFAYPASTR